MDTGPDFAAHADALMTLLDAERAAFLTQWERVPRARRDQRPGPERWSPVEIVEHLARTDAVVARLLALRTARPRVATAEELLAAELTSAKTAAMRDPAVPAEAPESVRPTGVLSADEALAQLTESREALKSAYQAAPATVLDDTVHPHPALGPTRLRGWVEFLAHHDARHTGHMRSIADSMV
jgi:thioesterase domain-containing protein